MSYNMFIDDERNPIDVKWGDWYMVKKYRESDWVIVRNWTEFNETIDAIGFPEFISFDHDLGDDALSGHEIAKNIIELDMDQNILPKLFKFNVHSQNPVGKKNIEELLNNYLEQKNAK